MAEEKLVPKLRFRGFGDEWNEFKLGEIGSFKNGVNKSKDDFGHGFPFINLEDIFNKDVLKKDEYGLVNVSNKELKEYDLKKGDVLFVRSSVKPEGVGLTTVVSEDLVDTVYSGFIIRFREEKQFIHDDFKKYCFKIRPFRNSLMSMSTTSANTNINQDSLNKLKIKVPTLNEQKKIGSFLNLIDIKLDLLHNKHKSYVNFKKYLMQQIFAQKLRFADYNDEWISKKLGKIVEFLDNKRIPLNEDQRNNQKNIYPYYGASGIIDYVEDYIFDEELILIGEDGTIDVNLASGKFWVSNHAHVLRAKDEINQYFLSEFLKTINFEIYNTGTIQPKLNKETCKSIPIKLPSSLEEQNKIADILFDVNLKLNYIQKEVNEVQNFRKGLLQQMFI